MSKRLVWRIDIRSYPTTK